MKFEIDYQYTCPVIDECIEECRDLLIEHLEEYTLGTNLKEFAKGLGDEIADRFETIRTENENLRTQGNKQLEEAAKEIEALEDRIRDLEYELENQE